MSGMCMQMEGFQLGVQRPVPHLGSQFRALMQFVFVLVLALVVVIKWTKLIVLVTLVVGVVQLSQLIS